MLPDKEDLVIKLGFDPNNIKEDHFDEDDHQNDRGTLDLIFSNEGLALRIWIILKRMYITNQHFLPAMRRVYNVCRNAQLSNKHPYKDLPSFVEFLNQYGVTDALFGGLYQRRWITEIIKYWDYLNPNIMKRIYIEYKDFSGTMVIRRIGNYDIKHTIDSDD